MKWNSFRKGLNGGFHMLQSNALTDLYYVPQLLPYYRQIAERLVEQIYTYLFNSSRIILQQNIVQPICNTIDYFLNDTLNNPSKITMSHTLATRPKCKMVANTPRTVRFSAKYCLSKVSSLLMLINFITTYFLLNVPYG